MKGWHGVSRENRIPEVRHRGLATDPVEDGALNIPLGRILNDVVLVAHLIRNSLISADANPGVWIRWVGLKVMLPVVAVHLDRHEFDVGVIEVQEGRLALRRMAEHIGFHVGRRGLGLGRDFLATLTLLYAIVSS